MSTSPRTLFDRLLHMAMGLGAAGIGLYLAASTLLSAPALNVPGERWLARTECCTWTADVETWDDANGDGLRDPAESPLEGVEIIATGYFQRLTVRTGREGTASLRTLGSCLGNADYEVRPVPPPGYRLSAAAAATGPRSFTFGFASLVQGAP